MTRRRTTTAFVILTSLAAISAGAWGLSKWRPFANDSPDLDWPKNVQPLIDYIEEASDLRFRNSINFNYIAGTSYDEAMRDPVEDFSDEARAGIETKEAVGRALGLWAGNRSLGDSINTINSAAPRPVSWFPDDNLVVIKAGGEGSNLPAYVRADLVVYLTQALVDQHFQLLERLGSATTSQEYEAVAAVYVGFALWIHDQYIEDLDAADTDAYEFDTADQYEEYAETVTSVPTTFLAIRIAHQVLGPGFIVALAEDDRALALRALRELPVAMDQISLPVGKYLRNDALESVEEPPGPSLSTIHFSDQMGPLRLYLMFVTGSPANEALTASDGWGNDRYTAYELDGRVCVDVHVVADSRADADRMEAAMNRWALARPRVAGALVGRNGVNLYASVCDPGSNVGQSIATDDEIDHYFSRGALLRQHALDTGKPALAECIAVKLYADFTIDEIAYESDIDIDAEFAAIEEECRNSI